jgi:hydrogenase/urease accessory protein HupE
MKAWAFSLALIACIGCGSARADELKPGYLELTQDSPNLWTLIWKAPNKGDLTDAVKPHIPSGCNMIAQSQQLSGIGIVLTQKLDCSTPLDGVTFGLSGLENTVSDVLVRIAPLDQPVQAARLTPKSPMIEIADKPQRLDVVRAYGLLGIEHILTGYDHLLFVLTLVLLLQQGWRVAAAVTAFTLAHSFTLIASTLGFIGLPRLGVESCIALSIVFLAVEVVKIDATRPRMSERYPWGVAFVFGLLHGFGFAGALSEIGLPQGEVPAALLAFNLGVEIGQLVIVGGVLTLLALIRRLVPAIGALVVKISAYGIGAIASAWLIERLAG